MFRVPAESEDTTDSVARKANYVNITEKASSTRQNQRKQFIEG